MTAVTEAIRMTINPRKKEERKEGRKDKDLSAQMVKSANNNDFLVIIF